jgi:uncharacterized protein YjiS (DUF1127 family)
MMPLAATTTLMHAHCEQPGSVARLGAALRPMVRTLRLWRRRYRERHAFPVLDEREMRDLRLTRWEIERELAKPFWRG